MIEQVHRRAWGSLARAPDAARAQRECLGDRPATAPGGYLFWNQKRKGEALCVKAIQKKMEGYVRTRRGREGELPLLAPHVRVEPHGRRGRPGTVVPHITVSDLSGRGERLSFNGGGKPTVLYVLSPTCKWCERNVQNIRTLAGGEGLFASSACRWTRSV